MSKDITKAEIKAQLGEYFKLREECEHMRQRIQTKRVDMEHLREAMQQSVARHDRAIARRVNLVLALMDRLIGYYSGLLAEREEAERRVLQMLARVENRDGQRILYLHYIEGMPFEEIPYEMCISMRTMWNKYKIAMEELCAMRQEQPQNRANRQID